MNKLKTDKVAEIIKIHKMLNNISIDQVTITNMFIIDGSVVGKDTLFNNNNLLKNNG